MLLHSDAGVAMERRAMQQRVGGAPVAAALPLATAWLRAARTSLVAAAAQHDAHPAAGASAGSGDGAGAAGAAAGRGEGQDAGLSTPDGSLEESRQSARVLSLPAAAQVRAHVTQGLLDIAASNAPLTGATCPETLELDVPRVFALQNEVQRLALIAALQLIATQILQRNGVSMAHASGHAEWQETLQSRLSVCMGSDAAKLDSIASEVSQLIQQRCSSQGVQLSDESRQLAERMVRKTVSADDAVFKTAQRTVLAALKQALSKAEHADVAAKLAPAGAESLAGVVCQVAASLMPMLDLNVLVHEPVYTAIVQCLIQGDQASDP